ncbi:CapA family protein [Saccharothrix luteola]|uniref:CapA family protein n=1 Tax=Saccharothrix luteola TaxID=2893018 RepID=UPI0027E363ED|nr:CapA family protein [Saccharothrix luteola]MCC8247121.1 CapA family protein [Saccharothrix luteola]MCC8249838.1 CapA family protein [Saccharothrix luteola]
MVTVFLCGDVMTGRGVDQILPHPGDPRLHEPYVRDARTYVALAEQENGPIPRPVDFAWPWGDALHVLDREAPDVRLINLETSVTGDGERDVAKQLHYRMSPGNVPCLTAARPDACALANNHVLDFGRRGLVDTLDALTGAGIAVAGAGRTASEAEHPAVLPAGRGSRVVFFSLGAGSSGIPHSWAATRNRAGVNLLPDVSEDVALDVTTRVCLIKRPGDVVVASLHWGSNWGYDVPDSDVDFAHALVDGGVDIVHGHSSHHPRPIEVYHGKLILYGCGDLINDYEGITGHEEYRDDLRLLYFAAVRPDTGHLVGLRMAPMRVHRMRLHHTDRAGTDHLRSVLDRISHPFGSRVDLREGMLDLRMEISEQKPPGRRS